MCDWVQQYETETNQIIHSIQLWMHMIQPQLKLESQDVFIVSVQFVKVCCE